MAQTMLAAAWDRNGPARDVLRLIELPKPEPKAGEVRIRIHASGVNPVDVKQRKRRPLNDLSFVVPHIDGAGVIDAVGEGVPSARIGERVWIWYPHWADPYGTAAEYVALPAERAVPLPDDVDFEVGACIGVPLLTAYRAVTYDGSLRGETVLIAGGAGAVGHYAVQLAKREGARVIATVSSARKAADAKAAGADIIINYREEDIAERVTAAVGKNGVDRVIETNLVANAGGYVRYLRPDGNVIVYGSDDWTVAPPMSDYLFHGIRLAFFIVINLAPAVRARAHAEIGRLLREGALKHRIAARFPLSEIAAAHEAVEEGAIGNVIVVP